jgi:hypothetical protein
MNSNLAGDEVHLYVFPPEGCTWGRFSVYLVIRTAVNSTTSPGGGCNMDGLLQSFEEFSVLWILISAGVGGLIGALVKFIFEQVLATKYRKQVDAKAALRMYKYPILRAADTLDRRIQNFIQFVDRNWYEDDEENYYRISTLYLFGCYFGWCRILEDEAFIEFETSTRRAKRFNIMFNTVYKGLTGFQYFGKVDDIPAEEIENASVPRMVITAIGELMRKPRLENTNATVLDFIEFARNMDASTEFHKWFGYLDTFLTGIRPSKNSAKWNRLLVFATNLRTFISYLDTEERQTAPRKIYYLKRMHLKVQDQVRKQLEKQGYLHLLPKEES